jgi:hypothetical protein
MQVGDTYTVAGVYTRRTFWQWLRRAPRQLLLFTVLPQRLPTQAVNDGRVAEPG